jgi:hypothetical protein
MKGNKLKYIGIVPSLDIAGMKVWSCLPDTIVHNVAINIGSIGNLEPTAGLSMLKMHIIITTWTSA